MNAISKCWSIIRLLDFVVCYVSVLKCPTWFQSDADPNPLITAHVSDFTVVFCSLSAVSPDGKTTLQIQAVLGGTVMSLCAQARETAQKMMISLDE